MKLTTFIILLACMHVHAVGFGQTITLNEKQAKIEKIFDGMEKQSGMTFFYKEETLKSMPTANINVINVSIKEALEQLLKNSPLSYAIVDKTVVITKRELKPAEAKDVLSISGKVIDEQGNPLPGVTVKLKESGAKTATTVEGKFIILLVDQKEKEVTVQFSYVGYESREIKLKAPVEDITIKMKQSVGSLDQVQILAYGTSTKRNLTGNVTTITAKDLEKSPVQNVLQALQGKVPGLFIQQNSGLPGSSYNVTVRAGSSLGSPKASPLFIVDGVTYPAGTTLPLLSGYSLNTAESGPGKGQGGNALNFLSVNDIESVTVLKDADATSIYGSRGAFGVILITTKKGKAGKPALNLNVYTGLNIQGDSPDLLNTEQYLTIRREALKNDGSTPGTNDLDLVSWPQDRYTNWANELLKKTSATAQSNLTLTGGNGGINYRLSGNYRYEDNPQKGKGDVNSGGFNFNINATPSEKLRFNLSGGFNTDVNTLIPFDLAGGPGLTAAPNAPPILLPDGSLNWETGENNYAGLNSISTLKNNSLLGNLAVTYTPIKSLSINGTLGYSYINGKDFHAKPSTFFNPASTNVASQTTSELKLYSSRSINVDLNASYDVKTWEKGNLNLRTGLTLQDVLGYGLRTKGTNFVGDALLYNPASAATVESSYNQDPTKYVGYFASARYSWDNKYILNATGRYDGSTKFGPNKRFGLFGSLGAAWIASDEKWFKDNLTFISFAKLRGSIGTVGGDAIPNYKYLPTFSTGAAYLGKPTLIPGLISNPDLHWEKKREIEGELLLEFLKGRISLDGTYYVTRSTDQLNQYPTSTVTGFATSYINSPAVVQTSGWEIIMTTKNIVSPKFSWTTSFNISLPKSKLVAFEGLATTFAAAVDWEIGKPVTGSKFYKYVGVNPQTGHYNFQNAAGLVSEFSPIFGPNLNSTTDKTEFIDLAPKYFGGLVNSFTIGNFNLDISLDFKNIMGKTFWGSQILPVGLSGFNGSVLALDRWQKPGDVTEVPAPTAGINNFLHNNFINSDGAYTRIITARINNVSLSYNFNEGLVKRMHLRNLNVFARGQNLFRFSNQNYKGLDPENLTLGIQGPLRVATFGFNVTF